MTQFLLSVREASILQEDCRAAPCQSNAYVSRSEKFMKGVEIMEELVPGMQEKILSGQTKSP